MLSICCDKGLRRWAALLVTCCAALIATSPASAKSASAKKAPKSAVTQITVTGATPVGTFGGVPYVRTWGVLSGEVAPGEAVRGLDALRSAPGASFPYTAEFEVFAPAADAKRNHTIIIEPENRGNSLLLGLMNNFPGPAAKTPATTEWPVGLGNGFLFNNRISYGRIQWESARAAGVPATAQGVGQIIVRDFGRLMRGDDNALLRQAGLKAHRTPILAGWSQSAWFVNTFIAEGFNADPSSKHGRGVYKGALALDGAGNWLAINQLNGDRPQYPYTQIDEAPLTPRQLLSHKRSDPFMVDISAYTDFYRVRAGLFSRNSFPDGLRHYDWPAAHGPAWVSTPAAVFGPIGCNKNNTGPTKVPALNPLDTRPYVRTLVLGLRARLDDKRNGDPRVPSSKVFKLAAQPATIIQDGDPELPLFLPLPGVDVKVPATDKDASPIGGVRFPEVEAPLGRLAPVSIAPVYQLISTLCGNFGGYEPFTAAQLQARYGGVDGYLRKYSRAVDKLIDREYLLPGERAGLLTEAAAQYAAAPAV